MKKKGTNSLIVGGGEVGKGLYDVLSKSHPTWVMDLDKKKTILFDDRLPFDIKFLHICIPPSEHFDEVVTRYQRDFNPEYTVIHSSVPLGTSRRLGAFHSPIRGVHPHMAKGIKTFVKFLAPMSSPLKRYFEVAGVHVKQVKSPETTESLKLWDTTYYGWNIIFEKILHQWCKENGVDYHTVYVEGNQSYNEGYKKLGRSEVVRPVLKHFEGGIGGHCVMPNLALFNSPVADFLKHQNEQFSRTKVSRVSQTARKGGRRAARRG